MFLELTIFDIAQNKRARTVRGAAELIKNILKTHLCGMQHNDLLQKYSLRILQRSTNLDQGIFVDALAILIQQKILHVIDDFYYI